MAKPVARSKSVALKRGKRPAHTSPDVSQPHLVGTDAEPRHDLCSIEVPPPKRADSGTASEPGDEMVRPRTASSAVERSRAWHIKGAPVVVRANDQTSDFPTPSPEPVLHAPDELDDRTIGMALGSPTQVTTWKQSHPANVRVAAAFTPPNVNVEEAFTTPFSELTTSEAGKKKVRRWRSIFGIKPSEKPPPTPFYQLQQSVPPTPGMPMAPAPAGSQGEDDGSATHVAPRADPPARLRKGSAAQREHQEKSKLVKAPKEGKRSRSRSRSIAGNRPEALPLDAPKIPTRGYREESSSPKPPPKHHHSFGKRKGSQPAMQFGQGKEERPQMIRAETSPMLNVDIPSIEMERYSIMFGSLLRGDRSSNLLARRQGTAEKLKPLNPDSLKLDNMTISSQTDRQTADDDDSGFVLKPPTRRATSPATPTFATPTYALSLFPRESMSSTRIGSPVPGPCPAPIHSSKRHPLQRAFTAPSAISPRHRTAFDVGDRSRDSSADSNRQKRPVIAQHITAEPEETDVASSVSTLDSSVRESFDSNETAILVRDPWPDVTRSIDDGAWEMVTRPVMPHVQSQQGSGSSSLSMQSQSPLSTLSERSFQATQQKVAQQTSAMERERVWLRQQREEAARERAQSQAQAQSQAPSPPASRKGQQQRGESLDSKTSSNREQDQQQPQGNKEQKGQKTEQQRQQPPPLRRQPTLKERAEEVQQATRMAIARQVSMSRQHAQQEMLRANAAAAKSSSSGTATPGTAAATPTIASPNQMTPTGAGSANGNGSKVSTPTPTLMTPEQPQQQQQQQQQGKGRTPTIVTQSPTGERLIVRRTLTPVLVETTDRKSIIGQVFDA